MILLTEKQDELYQFLCMDAYTTTAKEDMQRVCRIIRVLVSRYSDRLCMIELQQEMMSDYEMESLEDEALIIALNEPDCTNLEQRVAELVEELLFKKATD